MADLLQSFMGAFAKRFRDMGDGTHSEVVTAVIQGNQAAHTNRSGTIAAGGAQQQLMAANPNRRGYWIQNQSTGDLWINGLGNASAGQPSLRISAGALYESPVHGVGTAGISIFGATTGQAFAAREF